MNAGLPAVWLIDMTVEDLVRRLEELNRRGGPVVSGPRGGARDTVIRDPSGAHAALYQAGSNRGGRHAPPAPIHG